MLEHTPGLFTSGLMGKLVPKQEHSINGVKVNYALVHVGANGFERALLRWPLKWGARFVEMHVARGAEVSEILLSFESVEQAIGYMQGDGAVLKRLKSTEETNLEFPFSSCISDSGKATFIVYELEQYRRLADKPFAVLKYDNGNVKRKYLRSFFDIFR
jgi:hypothetical protein